MEKENSKFERKYASLDDLVRLKDNFLQIVSQSPYFIKVISGEIKKRLIFVPHDDVNYQGHNLGICDSCSMIYHVTKSRDLFMIEENGEQIPYCETCSIERCVNN